MPDGPALQVSAAFPLAPKVLVWLEIPNEEDVGVP